jgi:hypothetical protein
MAFILVWVAVVVTASGTFIPLKMPERTPFADKAACEAFAESYKERMADYTRGLVQGEWDLDVHVGWQCEPAGRPA